MDADSAWDALAKAKANLKKVDKAVNEAVDDASRYSLSADKTPTKLSKRTKNIKQRKFSVEYGLLIHRNLLNL